MPVQVIKSSDNGFVDANSKVVRFPAHMTMGMPKPERRDTFRKASLVASVPLALLTISSLPAQGSVITLTDGTSSAVVDTGSALGLKSLVVDGTEQGHAQWFYYRLSGSGAATAINTLNQTALIAPGDPLTGGGNEPANMMSVTLSAPSGDFDIKVNYRLTDAPVGGANINEDLSLDNNTNSPLLMNFFQYNNFRLNVTTDDSVSITGGNTASQSEAGGVTTSLETVATQQPDHYEAALTPTILNEFSNSGFGHLPGTTTAGPGDATWAFEWDPTIPANQSFLISKVRSVSNVPEPTSAMMFLGGATLLMSGRRRRNNATAAAK